MTNKLGLNRRHLMLAGTTLAASSALAAGAPPSAARAQDLNPQPLPPSPEWARALPPGPDTRREDHGRPTRP